MRDLTTGQTQRVLVNERYNIAVNWSPDGHYLTAVDLRSNTDLHVWLYDAESDTTREALPHDDESSSRRGHGCRIAPASMLSATAAASSRAWRDLLAAHDALRWVLTPDLGHRACRLSADGRRIVWVQNESGRGQLYLRDDDGVALRVVGLPLGVIEQIRLTSNGHTLALRINSATAPAEVYVVTFGADRHE